MKRNVKNDKVIKAMTIGLAAMIAATSAPVNVYAEGEEGETPAAAPAADAAPADENHDDAPAPVADAAPAAEVTEIAPVAVNDAAIDNAQTIAGVMVPTEGEAVDPAAVAALQTAENPVLPNPAVSIDGAKNAIGELINNGSEQPIGVQADLNAAVGALGDAAEKVEDVKNELDDLEGALSEAGQSQVTPIEVSEKSVKVLPTVTDEEGNSKLERNEDGSIIHNEDGSIYFFDTTNDQPVIKSMVEDYSKAVDYVNSGDLDNADKAVKNADKLLKAEEAKIQTLSTAIQDSKAAEANVQKAKDNLKKVQGIRDQYCAFLTQYYNTVLGADNVPYKDGTIDFDGCASLLKAKGDAQISRYADGYDNVNDNVFKLGRNLLEKIVKAEISDSKENIVDGEKGIKFGVKVTDNNGAGGNVNSAEGKITQSNGKDQVSFVNGKQVYRYSQSEAKKAAKDGGRTNRFAVQYSYIDENNEKKDVTEYYNIVYKSTSHENKDDLSLDSLKKGVVYVAKVEWDDETKEWKEVDANSKYDDFNLINNAIKAVDDAEKEAAALRKAIEDLGYKATGTEDLDALQEQLDYYEGVAKFSREKLDALIELIGELSVVDDSTDDTSDDTSDDTPSTVIPGPGGFTYTIPGGYTLPSGMLDAFGGTGTTGGGGAASGVLGERVPEEAVNAATPLKYTKLPALKKNNTNKKAKLVKIEDPETPLASMPMEDSVEFSWWWLLLIFLLGATGKKMYDNYQEKKREEEAAKLGK